LQFFERGKRDHEGEKQLLRTALSTDTNALRASTTASGLFKSLNEYITGKLNWSSCVGVCTDGAAAMIGSLSGLTVWIKEVAPECQATHCVNHREMLASRKISPELHSVFHDIVKMINLIKAHALKHPVV